MAIFTFPYNDVGGKKTSDPHFRWRWRQEDRENYRRKAKHLCCLSPRSFMPKQLHTHVITVAKVLVVAPSPPFLPGATTGKVGLLYSTMKREKERHTLANKTCDNDPPWSPAGTLRPDQHKGREDELTRSSDEPGPCYAFPHSTYKCTWVDY